MAATTSEEDREAERDQASKHRHHLLTTALRERSGHGLLLDLYQQENAFRPEVMTMMHENGLPLLTNTGDL